MSHQIAKGEVEKPMTGHLYILSMLVCMLYDHNSTNFAAKELDIRLATHSECSKTPLKNGFLEPSSFVVKIPLPWGNTMFAINDF
jgi:hypothetical protein